jgi:hypothetical protein
LHRVAKEERAKEQIYAETMKMMTMEDSTAPPTIPLITCRDL